MNAVPEIRIIASNAVKEPYKELLPVFETGSGARTAVSWGGTLDILERVEGGEAVDIVVLPAVRIDGLIEKGLLASRVDLTRSGVGVGARAGMPKPDVSSLDALRNALLAAATVILSSGPSSLYMPTLFEKLSIADAVKPKIKQLPPGAGVGAALARGEGDIGFTQMSELISVEGIQYLGPLPADVQFITVFSAGVHATASDAARALIAFLTSAEAAPVLKHHGLLLP